MIIVENEFYVILGNYYASRNFAVPYGNVWCATEVLCLRFVPEDILLYYSGSFIMSNKHFTDSYGYR